MKKKRSLLFAKSFLANCNNQSLQGKLCHTSSNTQLKLNEYDQRCFSALLYELFFCEQFLEKSSQNLGQSLFRHLGKF